MAMACRPDLIFFDEPTTALDVTTQIEVLAAIKDIVRQFHTAAIYISHDLAVVAQMADRVMVLRHGELVEEAPTRTMLSDPQQPYTKSLWAVRALRKEEAPSDDDLLRSMPSTPATAPSRRCTASPSGSRAAAPSPSSASSGSASRPRAGHHRSAAAGGGGDRFRRQKLPPRLKNRDKTLLRRIQMIYQMPDTALIRGAASATSSAARSSIISASPAPRGTPLVELLQ